MKIFRTLLLGISFLFASTGYAQVSSGVVNYTGVINQTYVDSFLTDLEQKDLPMNIKQGVVDIYTNATPDEYVLNFKEEESYYYHKPALEVEEEYNIGSKAGKNSYYTSNASDTIVEMSAYLGNIAHEPLDWEITGNKKTVGGFQCYGAVATEKLYSRQGHYYYREVVAWFAPEIPLNFGPKHYKGLPGLILKIERAEFTLTATKLNLNPGNKDIKISRLDKNDKVISQEEAHGRIAEMQEDRQRSR